jgi:Xaa-Pro aminopeptidase
MSGSHAERAARGFPPEEFAARLSRAQAQMARRDLAALLLTTEPEIRYFTGFLTRFWESPTRPWFVIVPQSGAPVAVIPSIGEALMRQCAVDDIRTWQAPNYDDDGVSLLADAVREVVPEGQKIGLAMGLESHLRMPLQDFERVKAALGRRTICDDAGLVRDLRAIKSPLEISKLRASCAIASAAFARVPQIARGGVAVSDVFRRFQILCLEEGADWVPYLSGAAGQGGYGDVISPASDDPLMPGDVLMMDTGIICDGYFSDFDRNFSIGPPNSDVKSAYARVIAAAQAGFEAARPGATAADLFHAMDRIASGGASADTSGGPGASAGRLGHGLGMQLTEWPSLIAADHTVLAPGMVLTLEPSVEVSPGRLLVHEENIVIGDKGADYLSTPAAPDMPVLEPR